MDLATKAREGDRRALGRLLTLIENDDPLGLEALSALYPHTGRAHVVGITGASGTGKSTLVNRLAYTLRRGDSPPTIAVVAVDPSSPFSGGAILGDRIRMHDLAGDRGVFIRSMASRGALGGLAAATGSLVAALDGAGFDLVIIETVGAGQSEVEIARTAHTTLVVEAPGLGDEVQAIKAGILEIADVLAVNKADLPGADHAVRMLRATLETAYPASEPGPGWKPPVIPTVATRGDGVEEVAQAIFRHREFLVQTGQLERFRRDRARAEMEMLLRESLFLHWQEANTDGEFEAALESVLARQLAPRQAVEQLLAGRAG
jgi:LAO/AO transport system kinase